MQVVRPNNLMLTPVGIGVAGPSRIVSRSPLPPSLVHLVTQPPPGLAVIPAVSSILIPAATLYFITTWQRTPTPVATPAVPGN